MNCLFTDGRPKEWVVSQAYGTDLEFELNDLTERGFVIYQVDIEPHPSHTLFWVTAYK
jgi:hypothetical protein